MSTWKRSDFGAERSTYNALGDFKCQSCGLSFHSEALLQRHKEKFCSEAKSGHAGVKSLTVDELKDSLRDHVKRQAIGKLSVAKLRQAVQNSSWKDVQYRGLQSDQQDLIARVKEFKALRTSKPAERANEEQGARRKEISLTSLIAREVLSRSDEEDRARHFRKVDAESLKDGRTPEDDINVKESATRLVLSPETEGRKGNSSPSSYHSKERRQERISPPASSIPPLSQADVSNADGDDDDQLIQATERDIEIAEKNAFDSHKSEDRRYWRKKEEHLREKANQLRARQLLRLHEQQQRRLTSQQASPATMQVDESKSKSRSDEDMFSPTKLEEDRLFGAVQAEGGGGGGEKEFYARSGQQNDSFMDEAMGIDHLELELQTLQKIENLKMMMNTESLPEQDPQIQVAPQISETYHEAQLEPVLEEIREEKNEEEAEEEEDPPRLIPSFDQDEDESQLETGPNELVSMAREHGLKMMKLKQESERLAHMKQLMEIQNELEAQRQERARAEWLRAQRMKMWEVSNLRSLAKGGAYDPFFGFTLRFCEIHPAPSVDNIQVVLGLFESGNAIMQLQTLPKVEVVYDFQLNLRNKTTRKALINMSETFVKLPPSNVMLVLELQTLHDEVSSSAIGWAAMPLFSPEREFLGGSWRIPILEPPLLLNLTPERLNEAKRLVDDDEYHYIYLKLEPNDSDPQDEPSEGEEEEDEEEEMLEGQEKFTNFSLPPCFHERTPLFIRSSYEVEEEEEEISPVKQSEQNKSIWKEEEQQQKVEVDPSLADIPQLAWCPWGKRPTEEEGDKVRAGPQDNVLVVLDAVRFLPDNVAVSKATLTIVNEEGNDASRINVRHTAVADPSSGTHSPTFDLFTVFPVFAADKNCWVQVRLDCFDMFTKSWATLGFSIHRIFLDFNPVDLRRTVKVGGIQIPLRSLGKKDRTFAATPADVGKLPRIPCCTVLLRIYVNPDEQDYKEVLRLSGKDGYLKEIIRTEQEKKTAGSPQQAKEKDENFLRRLARCKPKYASGAYDSDGVVPSGYEKVLFQQRVETLQRDISMRDALARMSATEYEDIRKQQDEELKQTVLALFKNKERSLFFDLTYFCLYNPAAGFRVCIDGANNLPTSKGFFPIAIFGAVPPCHYFSSDRYPEHAQFQSSLNPLSSLRCPRWTESYSLLSGVEFRGYRCGLVVQLLGISRIPSEEGGRLQVRQKEIGWTVLPLFLRDKRHYIIDGNFQVPLYSGSVPRSLPETIFRLGVEAAVREEERKRKLSLLPNASVFIRVVDVQREKLSQPLKAHVAQPPQDAGIPEDVDRSFLEFWVTQQEERLPPKTVEGYKKVKKNSLLQGRELSVEEILAKEEKKKNPSFAYKLAEFEAQLRSDTAAITRISPQITSNK